VLSGVTTIFIKTLRSAVRAGVAFDLTITWSMFTGYMTLVCILTRIITACTKRYPLTFYAGNESFPVRVISLYVLNSIISVPPCSGRVECGNFRETLLYCLFIDSCCFTIAKQEINSKKVKPFACEIRLASFHSETTHLSI